MSHNHTCPTCRKIYTCSSNTCTGEDLCYECLEAELTECKQRLIDAREVIKCLTTVDQHYLEAKRATEAERGELKTIVQLTVESQGWDGNNPDDDRWANLYKRARNALEGKP